MITCLSLISLVIFLLVNLSLIRVYKLLTPFLILLILIGFIFSMTIVSFKEPYDFLVKFIILIVLAKMSF